MKGAHSDRAAAAFLVAFVLVAGTATAQERPTLAALPITDPILVDGDLSDSAWMRADVATDFVQTEPSEGAQATERTELQIVYTRSTLYIGIRARHSEPSSIVAMEMERDAPLHRDDSIVVLLDTFHDRRNAYSFETNPNGARFDALITDEGRDINREWDGVWTVESRRNAEGWIAEMAIPFSTLRFDPALDTWGLNVRRMIRHKNEEVHWAALVRGLGSPRDPTRYSVYRISLAGELTGLHDLQPSRQLDLKPFVVGSVSQSPGSGESATQEDLELGLDAKWGIGKSLRLDFTYNTDFAEVEVDEQQVNLTRFSLFFPEKREFFLENAGIFEFGLPDRDFFEPVPMRIFFSRRIGLEDGLEVPIDGGVRLTGRVGGWNAGVLDVMTDDQRSEGGPAETNFAVIRAKKNIGRRSGIGFIATDRNESGSATNQVLGVDFDYKPTEKLDFAGFLAQTDDASLDGEDSAWGYGFGYQGRDFQATFEHTRVEPGFQPGIGFLLRSDFERLNPRLQWRPRIDRWGLKTWFFEATMDQYDRASMDELESRAISFSAIGMRTKWDDGWGLNYVLETERLFEPFEIAPGIVIPAGSYNFEGWRLGGRTNEARRISLRGRFQAGDFFDGERFTGNLTIRLRASRHLRSETTISYNDVELPQGDFTASVLGERLDYSFNPDLKLSAFLQYNDTTELVAANIRFNWIYRPGADLFLVYNENWDAPSFGNRSTRDRQFIVKFTYLYQR